MNRVTGTLIWYYYLCHREVWLMAHEINPNQDNQLIDLGRLIHEESYQREKKEFETAGMKIDILGKKDGKLLIAEVKKSSRFLESATMQLSFYLYRLKELGFNAGGELLIPKERKRIAVELTPELEDELKKAFEAIEKIISRDKPPEPVRVGFCKRCAYREFCWV